MSGDFRRADSTIEATMGKIVSIAVQFDSGAGAAQSDPFMSPLGKRERINELATTARAALDNVEQTDVAAFEQRSARVAAKLTPVPPARDLAWELRAQELRRPFAALSLMERGALYASLPSGPEYDDLRMALESGPWTLEAQPGQLASVVPFIPASLVEASVQARIEAANPQAAGEVRECRMVVNVLRGLVASCRAGIDSVSPVRTSNATAAA